MAMRSSLTVLLNLYDITCCRGYFIYARSYIYYGVIVSVASYLASLADIIYGCTGEGWMSRRGFCKLSETQVLPYISLIAALATIDQ
ncbi:uncharacterized protein BJ212DRAFT_1324908 [Suillus subaureus]|uniref:Uncharacterized protein n=1 Tax=Suillus subaureus TaxID=48587 RepID=A0A9P7JI11_9AGAM|nr:uncharacterized protein BJ212DRAFT_1324908 [Suillus subaureus]KAG1823529.1 hypothetical protein BJ212DRAFT_1324908 [Suillus subaureus]